MKNVITTKQAAEILGCNTRSVPTIAQRYTLATGNSVKREKIGKGWAWLTADIKAVAEWREADKHRDGARWTDNTFTHMPATHQRVRRKRLKLAMERIRERNDKRG